MQNVKPLNVADGNEFLSVEEASNELGIQKEGLRVYLSEQKFTTYKFKKLTLLSKEEVEAWKKRQKRL